MNIADVDLNLLKVFEALLLEHYDPAYDRSIQRNFPRIASARTATCSTRP